MLKNLRISRIITQWVINTVGLLLIAGILPGVSITRWGSAFMASAVIGLFNMLLWPLFMRFALPVTVATLGLASLVLNGFIIALTASILPGFAINNFWIAMLVAVVITIVSTLAHQLLVIDDDDTYYRNVIKKQVEKNFKVTKTNTPGIIFLQIDGLAYKVLQRAIRDGNAPTLAKWLRSGEYRLESWETDWSSQTGASQAGILMGSNKEIPAFRWYEKETGKSFAFNNPNDLKIIEERISDKKGLLSQSGASRGNLFSGDAEVTLLTLSTITNPDRKHFGRDYYAYFANPYNFTRTIIVMIGDIIREIRSGLDQKRRDVRPRLEHREWHYPLLRAWTTVIQRDILVQTLISDMYKGRSVAYADFVGYDEVSHHTGIERYETLTILRDIDQQIARLARAAKDAPRPYHFVILSDHGQTQGYSFSQRAGYSLEELVAKLTRQRRIAKTETQEDLMYLNAAVTEAAQPKNFAGKIFRSISKRFREKEITHNHQQTSRDEIKVIGSGCLGLIYLTQFRHRLTYEEINRFYPELIQGLLDNPYIGFLLVKSKNDGGIVMGRKGRYFLNDDRVEGENPLLPFGEHAAMHVKRTHHFQHAADIMLNSIYDQRMDEVVPFEEFVGSHGGLGGNQCHPFVFFPNSWNFPQEEVIGAENIHKIMKRWVADTGSPKSTDRYFNENTGLYLKKV